MGAHHQPPYLIACMYMHTCLSFLFSGGACSRRDEVQLQTTIKFLMKNTDITIYEGSL